MRTVLIFILLFVIASPVFAQLTGQTVRQIIREELEPVKLDVAEMKGKMEALEGKMATKDDLINMRKDFSKEIKAVKEDVTEMKSKMVTKDDLMAMNKEISTTKDDLRDMWGDIIGKIYVLYGIIIAVLIAIIGVMLTIIFAPRWEKRNGKRLDRIEAEIDALKKTAREIAEENPEFAEAYRLIGLL